MGSDSWMSLVVGVVAGYLMSMWVRHVYAELTRHHNDGPLSVWIAGEDGGWREVEGWTEPPSAPTPTMGPAPSPTT